MFKRSAGFFCNFSNDVLKNLIRRQEEIHKQAGETGSKALAQEAQRIAWSVDELRRVMNLSTNSQQHHESVPNFTSKPR